MTVMPLDIAIDVSDNNDVVDWPALYAAGIRIAFIKIIEWPGHLYPSGPAQLAGARAAKIAAIPYGFLRPCDPGAYVREFAARCDLSPGMGFMLDWEGRASQTCSAQVAEQIGEQLALIAQRPPIGYWGEAGSTPAAPTNKMLRWGRFVPRYPIRGVNSFAALPQVIRDNPERWWKLDGGIMGLPRFGQYTAWGRVGGVKGLVDRSVGFFANEQAALDWVASTSLAKAAA